MTRKKIEVAMRKRGPIPGADCEVAIVFSAPEQRGDLGRVLMRVGDNGNRKVVWWLRCPWCREILDVPAASVNMKAGRLSIAGTISCQTCENDYRIADGCAKKLARKGH